MRRASDLLGLPVAGEDGSPLGTVHEVLVDFDRERLSALLTADKNFPDPGLIPVEEAAISPDNLTVPAQAVLRGETAAIYRQGKLTLEGSRKLAVVTDSGQKLGLVADLIFEGNRLVALELSEGMLQDVFEGRDVLSTPLTADLAQEVLVVPAADGGQGEGLISGG